MCVCFIKLILYLPPALLKWWQCNAMLLLIKISCVMKICRSEPLNLLSQMKDFYTTVTIKRCAGCAHSRSSFKKIEKLWCNLIVSLGEKDRDSCTIKTLIVLFINIQNFYVKIRSDFTEVTFCCMLSCCFPKHRHNWCDARPCKL